MKKLTPLKQFFLLSIKFSVSAILLYLIISKIGTTAIIDNITLSSPAAFIIAVTIYIISIYLSSLRWKLLIPQQVKTKRLFSLYMIGSFFNTYMPGIIGGDVVKAYYLNRELKQEEHNPEDRDNSPLTTSIASVFMDRYIGFLGLLIINLGAIVFGFKYLQGASLQQIMWAVPLLFILFITFSISVLKLKFGKNLKFLFNIYEYFLLYKAKRSALSKAFLYSLIIQISGVFAVYILSKGIALDIPFLSLLIFIPLIILISMIPISISGIGLREGAFVFFLSTAGVSPDLSATLSILWFLSVVVASLWGLFAYLSFKTSLAKKE
ncbi:MAG: lysylphosphatidylglycerol synthase transmembrane domain-containing protein [Thermodesulfovibrionales bacterium]|nr:lysylphosphatidylglycerol synthase transmembrane domain-containing protein [Thermodesulfovibrionales bacterium]